MDPPFSQDAYGILPPEKYFQVEPDLYGDRLLMIPGSVTLYNNDRALYAHVGTSAEIVTHMAFRNVVLSSAWAVDADYVVVDLGPSSSLLNQLIIMSCDYILPPVFADYFSLSSIHALLTSLLIGVKAKHQSLLATQAQAEANLQNNARKKEKAHGYSVQNELPKLLPFIVTNYRKSGNVFFGPGSTAAKANPGGPIKGKEAEVAGKELAGSDEKYESQPGKIHNGPGKFISAMRNLIADLEAKGNPSTQLFKKAEGHTVIPLVRALPTLMAHSQEVGVAAVSLSPEWWSSHKASLESPPSELDIKSQLGPDHLYMKARYTALTKFLDAL